MAYKVDFRYLGMFFWKDPRARANSFLPLPWVLQGVTSTEPQIPVVKPKFPAHTKPNNASAMAKKTRKEKQKNEIIKVVTLKCAFQGYPRNQVQVWPVVKMSNQTKGGKPDTAKEVLHQQTTDPRKIPQGATISSKPKRGLIPRIVEMMAPTQDWFKYGGEKPAPGKVILKHGLATHPLELRKTWFPQMMNT